MMVSLLTHICAIRPQWVNIWHVNFARLNTFIFDARLGVFEKLMNFINTVNVSTQEGFESTTFRFIPNALTLWVSGVKHLLYHVYEYWRWWFGCFCLQSYHLKFQLRAGNSIHFRQKDVLENVSKFLRLKMSWPRRDWESKPPDSCRMLQPFELQRSDV